MYSIQRFMTYMFIASAMAIVYPRDVMGQSQVPGVKNIVLVHGAFADGSSWGKVVPLLQKEGYHVIAVQNPLTSLEDDVAATARAISSMNGPVLLVGHSWAGMVITEAGDNPQVAGLLYVCAFTSDKGQSLEDVAKTFPPAHGNSALQLNKSGFLSLSVEGINEDFAQDLPAEDRQVLFATQGPWAAKCIKEPVSKAAWRTKPSWFIIGSNDHMINPELERSEARMINATTMELSSSHVPMLSYPGRVADFIMAASRKL